MYTFKDFIGNEQIVKNFKKSLVNNRLSHAYIINGQRGSGKKLLSNIIAKTLQCEEHLEDACCKCLSCKSFDSFNHPDVFTIKPTKTKAISVDDIRNQVNNIIDIKPYKYKYKIFIIENADTMTVAAQNALLKTIEEPPTYAFFILLSTNYNSFLQTILSRCVVIKLKPLLESSIKDYLVNKYNLEDKKATIISSFCQGSIGEAEDILNNNELIDLRNKFLDIICNIKQNDYVDIFNLSKVFDENKENINLILDIYILWFRDILIYKETKDNKSIVQIDKLSQIQQNLEFDNNSIFRVLDIIEDTKIKISKNCNFSLAVELMLIKIKENLYD